MNYDTMVAGREMDQLVAVKVMGWKTHCNHKGHLMYDTEGEGFKLIPEFTTDISAARAVGDKMGNKVPAYLTDPFAICLAALKAVAEKPVATPYVSAVKAAPEKKEEKKEEGK